MSTNVVQARVKMQLFNAAVIDPFASCQFSSASCCNGRECAFANAVCCPGGAACCPSGADCMQTLRGDPPMCGRPVVIPDQPGLQASLTPVRHDSVDIRLENLADPGEPPIPANDHKQRSSAKKAAKPCSCASASRTMDPSLRELATGVRCGCSGDQVAMCSAALGSVCLCVMWW